MSAVNEVGHATLRTALPDLRRPFPAESVKFKVQAGGRDGRKALCVCYIDARHVIERLNMVVAGDWHDEYEVGPGRSLVCKLTVCGVTRQDIGVMDDDAQGGPKAVYSDALKRAAVKFGVGVSLYAGPKYFADPGDLIMAPDRKAGGDAMKPIGLKDTGIAKLRAQYERWVQGVEEVFGKPYDHGDHAEALGDHEAEPPPGVDAETGEVTMSVRDRCAAWLGSIDAAGQYELSLLIKRAGLTLPAPATNVRVADLLVAEIGDKAATREQAEDALATLADAQRADDDVPF